MENVVIDYMGEIAENRSKAQTAFDRMLRKYPNAQALLRSYATFVRDVKNDMDLARFYQNKADALEAADANDT